MPQKLSDLLSRNRKFLPLSVTIFLFFLAYAVGAANYEGMRDPQIFLNLFRTSPFLLISAVGTTFVILTGGIDLSVSGVVALTTVASAALLRTGEWNPWVVMLLMLLMGSALGAIMGAFITYLKVQPFIATLAGMWFARGMCFFISDDAIAINNRVYRILGQTKILIPGLADPIEKVGAFISPLVVLEFIVLIVAIYIAHYTRFGRTIYAIGGNEGRNEQSARLMGLPADRTKLLVYTMNGFCSALAGIALSIYVSSGHGLYARGFEMTVIASVVIGGTMLTGGVGYVFGTMFGVLITGVIQTLIQFNGKLSSWWTNIVVGLLTLAFIGVQSLLAARKAHHISAGDSTEKAPGPRKLTPRQWMGGIGGAAVVLAIIVFALVQTRPQPEPEINTGEATWSCAEVPFHTEETTQALQNGAVVTFERIGGTTCGTEFYVFYADGRVTGDNTASQVEGNIGADGATQLVQEIAAQGWFTDGMYTTSHLPCGQCYTYSITVVSDGQSKTVGAVDGGTDAPSNYWQVVADIHGLAPKFTDAP